MKTPNGYAVEGLGGGTQGWVRESKGLFAVINSNQAIPEDPPYDDIVVGVYADEDFQEDVTGAAFDTVAEALAYVDGFFDAVDTLK